ncbi:helix-turn-helix domain-containing protein [Nesterenkonia suensis]
MSGDLSVADVMKELKVSRWTVYRWIADKTLDAYKLPHRTGDKASERRAEWRIPETEIERIKQGQARGKTFDRKRYQKATRPAA